MAKRSEKRDTAKAAYVAQRTVGASVNLKEFAKQQGVSYQTLRNWKTADKWEEAVPKKKRGGQPGNQNSAGHKNAAGSHNGAPPGNKNAERDGAYSAISFDMLTDAEKELVEKTPLGSREALEHEMKVLKYREHKILTKLTEYENAPQDSLYVNSLLDMRVPGKEEGAERPRDGAVQKLGMYSKDSAFSRAIKLQDALYKVQGRIARIADSIRALEEGERRFELERKRLDILEMRASGAVEIEVSESDTAIEPEEGEE